MLAQTPLWNHSVVDAVPTKLHCEAAEDIDDIAVATRTGRLLFQAKANDRLSIPPDALGLQKPLRDPFIKAIKQLVDQQQSGDAAKPPLDAATDRFVLAFKDATEHLRRLMKIAERVAPPATVSDDESKGRFEILRSGEEEEVFDRFVGVVHRLTSARPTWQQVLSLLRVSLFWRLEAAVTQRIEVDPANLLRSVLADGESAQNAIDVLSREIITLAAAAAGIDADGLRTFLSNGRFRLAAAPDCSRDVQRILDSTNVIVANMRTTQRPVFGPRVDRGAVTPLLTAMESGPAALVGERGMGKSNALLSVFDALRAGNHNVIVCDLRQATARALLTLPTGEALTNPLDTVLSSFPAPRPSYLLVDALEEAASDRDLDKALYSMLTGVARARDRWRILIASRPAILHGRREWRGLLAGPPIGDAGDPLLGSVRHLCIRRFSPEEQDRALMEAPDALKSAVSSSRSIQEFAAVPETLALLRDIPSVVAAPSLFPKAVLDLYWEHYIHSPQRVKVVVEIARAQRARKVSAVPLSEIVVDPVVVAELQNERVVIVAEGKVSFSHEPLGDLVHARFPSE